MKKNVFFSTQLNDISLAFRYIIAFGGSRRDEQHWVTFHQPDEAIVLTEIFRLSTNEDFVEMHGPALPDSRYHYGSSVVTSLDK